MAETWTFDDATEPLTADAVVGELRARIAGERYESWLTSSSGRLLAVVTNAERAMVMLLDHEGDPGEHATDPAAEGSSGGFVLSNGQDDEYPDQDTVPLPLALQIVRHIVAHGTPPADAAWTTDR
ncbi:Imm1 family immunity protein [Actinomadura fulvescens]|uniref:Immunity protein Imm1 n=1 Tax=Actinomadura fulvescens TaxID=46160 RepID=A0ABN3QKY9_9ACTN